MKGISLWVIRNSQLVTKQVQGTITPMSSNYDKGCVRWLKVISFIKVIHVPWEENNNVNLLSKISNTKKPYLNKIVIQETLVSPNM